MADSPVLDSSVTSEGRGDEERRPIIQKSMRDKLYYHVRYLAKDLGGTYVNVVHGPTQLSPAFHEEYFDDFNVHKPLVVDTGAHALGQWYCGDDIHLVCLSNTTASTFWDLCKERLELEDFKPPKNHALDLTDPKLIAPSRLNNTIGRFQYLCKQTQARCKVYIHWSKMPEGCVEAYRAGEALDAETHKQYVSTPYPFQGSPIDVASAMSAIPDARAKLDPQDDVAEGNLDLVCDMLRLGKQIMIYDLPNPSIPHPGFITAYNTLRDWTRRKGLYGPEYGYFSSNTLLWALYATDAELQPRGYAPREAWDNILFVRILDDLKLAFAEVARHKDPADAVIEIYSPTKHIATAYMTASAKQAIHNALIPATETLQEEYHLSPPGTGFKDFLTDYSGSMFVVRLEVWYDAPHRVKLVLHQFHERVRSLEPTLRAWKDSRGVGGCCTRVWPKLLREEGREDLFAYAVGLVRSPAADRLGGEPLSDCGARITEFLEDKAQPYDNLSGSIQVRPAGEGEFARLLPERELEDVGAALAAGAALDLGEERVELPAGPSAGPSTGGKFRTAGQALGRVRHDPKHSGVEYDVGYEDRFEGLVWLELEAWGGKETEDELWIPEHRVRKIKRREDGVVVWDRAERVDLLG